jgi:cell wall-associated NlpC family hydrolase
MSVRTLLVVLLASAVASGCAAKAPRVLPPAPPAPSTSSLIAEARSLIGAPYRNGGTSPDGFDCSGFTQYVFRQAGVRLPRSVADQMAIGQPVGRDRLHPGDLVFFAIDGRTVSHVGVIVAPGVFVHAPSSRGRVREESLALAYWETRFAGARRVTPEP